jgi:2-dehydro-3-deoxyphosphogalactonate aldolase
MPQPEDVPPLVAILRGVRSEEVLGIATVLQEAGISGIEVPLNSPDPLASIARLCETFGGRCLCGAGTVLSVADVEDVCAAGGRLIVTPNTDPAVIERAVALNLTVIPGFATATEAFSAIRAGARALKLFPAGTYGPGHLKAIRDVLPKSVQVLAVGGVGAANLVPWVEAGAAGAGVGGELYRAGDSPEAVGRRARLLVDAWRAAVAARAGTQRT